MHRLRMIASSDLHDLLLWLQGRAAPLARRGVLLFMQVDDPAGPTYVDIELEGLTETYPPERLLAEKLTRYLWGPWQYQHMKQRLQAAPEAFTEEEASFLAAAAFLRTTAFGRRARSAAQRRRRWMERELRTVLCDNDETNLDGFLRFRGHAFLAELDAAMRTTADEYLVSREYEEFLDILRYFLDTTPITPGIVYVLCKGDTAVGFDEGLQPLDLGRMERIALQAETRDLHPHDVLMSELITRAPERLVICMPEAGNTFAHTLMRVFAGRAELWTDRVQCDHLMEAIDNGHPTLYTSK